MVKEVDGVENLQCICRHDLFSINHKYARALPLEKSEEQQTKHSCERAGDAVVVFSTKPDVKVCCTRSDVCPFRMSKIGGLPQP